MGNLSVLRGHVKTTSVIRPSGDDKEKNQIKRWAIIPKIKILGISSVSSKTRPSCFATFGCVRSYLPDIASGETFAFPFDSLAKRV